MLDDPKGEIMKRLLLVSAVGAIMVAQGLMAAPAGAYGNTAQWQIGLSFNCNNPSLCGSELGGFWGWAEFDGDGTADAELIGCEHLQGGPAEGANHFSVDVQGSPTFPGWFIAPSTGAEGVPVGFPEFWITNEVDTITGRTGGPPVVVVNPEPPYPAETGVPAVAGHYSSQSLFGSQAPPGTAFIIQVARLHH